MIHFYSTHNKNIHASLEEAVMKGLAEDGGLFMPEHIPPLPEAFFKKMHSMTFAEISFEVSKNILRDAIPLDVLTNIIEKAINFDAPLIPLSSTISALELFHGPTLSFKDFGARFMAELMRYFGRHSLETLHILVATSGDTGSAIGQAFLNVPGIKVWILYPKGKVSLIQEKQLTTLGANITALEVDGTFDDCQSFVKKAFSDPLLRQKVNLTSANSINIARLIPQSFYYFYAYSQINAPVVFSVPSGNFGNLTAGLLAKKMGLPAQFVAATNINESVPKYLHTGIFEPRPSVHTLSNAMDVGNPSNFGRLLDLYKHEWEGMRHAIYGESFTDDQTRIAIKEVFENSGYLMDPHGAVAYLGLKSYLKKFPGTAKGVFLETAHPSKFADDVEEIIGQKVPIPERLERVLAKEKKSILLEADYENFRRLLT